MRWVILALLFIFYVINFADKSVLGLASEPIMNDLNLNYEQFGLAGSSFYWMYAVGSIFIAGLSNRFGTKKLLMFLALGWTISLVSAYLVNTLTLLVVVRVLLGFFEGATLALCITHLTKWFAPGARGTATAILLSGATFGAYLTAPLLVRLIGGFGWQFTFAALGVSSFIWLIAFGFFKEKPDTLRLAGYSAEGEAVPPVEEKQDMRISEVMRMLATPYFLAILSSFFIVMWMIAWIVVWAPTYLLQIVGLTPDKMAATFAFIGISAAVGTIVLGKISDVLFNKTKNLRKSYVFIALVSLVSSALAFGALTVVQTPVLAIIFLLIGITVNAAVAPCTASIISAIVPSRQIGFVLGFKMAVGSFAGIIAPLLTGYFVDISGDNMRLGFNYGVLVAVCLYAVSAIALFASSRKEFTFNRKQELKTAEAAATAE
ncbi:MFS transporter [Sporosarcina sp. P1]|uniref:MFS transporter n=1 Tax=Sporosarcina sp. P1 TaxID=2048257 RepID=UPI0013042D05|nr:MFS transporter [Sporosarcina sp. P1]